MRTTITRKVYVAAAFAAALLAAAATFPSVSAQAADTIGARALLVHATDDNAKGFYEHFTFEPSPSDPYHLFRLLKDIRAVATAMGDGVKKVYPSEVPIMQKLRRVV